MAYEWGEYRLDRQGTWLLKSGRHVDASRRVLALITHLIQERHRVVAHDELFRLLWGHDAVTHHQLTQIVVASRKAIGDDGHSQHLIRTFMGLGYRWLGEISEVDESAGPGMRAAAITPAPGPEMLDASTVTVESAHPPSPSDSPLATSRTEAGAPRRWRWSWRWVAASLSVACAALVALQLQDHQRTRGAGDAAAVGSLISGDIPDFDAIRVALWRGEYRKAEERIAALPPGLAYRQEAKLLAIHLDLYTGRFEKASRALTIMREDAAAAADIHWQARSLSTQSLLNGAMGKSGAEVLVPAKSAVLLLESSPTPVPPNVMGEALLARGYGHMKALNYDQAMRDLLRSRDLLAAAGNMHAAADAADNLARIHMRAGRYQQALSLFEEVAEYSRKSDFPVQEIFARNGMAKINVELLRWGDALACSERSLQLLDRMPETERRARVLLLRARALIGSGRLREAQASIRDVEVAGDDRYSPVTAVAHGLAAGDLDRAWAAVLRAQTFEGYGVHDTLLLESSEGALLLWLIVAQARAAEGVPVPAPTPEQRALLEAPASTAGLIARGRWFLLQGQSGPAEFDLRQAFADARALGHLADMLAATEPLVESLLARGDVLAAEDALQELWKHDPDTLAQDYAANLLKLRVASASSDPASARDALRAVKSLAGERALPEWANATPE